MSINQLLLEIKNTPDCHVFEPAGLPTVDSSKHTLPSDLKEFYTLSGGAVLFENSEYPISLVRPDGLNLANPVIVGDLYEEDISSDWYIICSDDSGEYLTIDLNTTRLGKCYDSFSDRHGLVGESQIIALSFTDLLERLIQNKGQYWYWLKNDFITLGDAYDNE